MIFRAELIRQIRAGKKTMTRRPANANPSSPWWHGRCKLRCGAVYAVQSARGRQATCKITVLDVRAESVGTISLDDARREGFRTRESFFAYWHKLYGPQSPAAPEPPAELTAEDAREQWRVDWRERWRQERMQRLPLPAIPSLVWVVSFIEGNHADRPRLLAARPGGPSGDYTDNPSRAAKGEPEAVPENVQEHYSTQARGRDMAEQLRKRHRALRAIDELAQHASGSDYRKLRTAAKVIRDLGTREPLRDAS